MAEEQDFPAGHENTEYILGSLDDETPTSSSEDSVESQKLTVCSENALICVKQPDDIGEDSGKVSVDRITSIRAEIELIKTQILSLDHEELERESKKYEEFLVQKTLSLDNIDSKGLDRVKELRKDAILFVQECLKLLDVNEK
ncbi:uncharacterized protein LOC109538994 [Dendroctonus ponderosae]|uniref:uncharacterized protein LOC109538994 n=1 Tax=Dendroctonus ponderosae TaxID=77166 RepID=UPI002036282D|nr:uncharacterized protein LOC109538994 [Dendroctonus ponderosae]KAH1025433.1 hypothetical protein HUJ05_010164 [Dendroctonus ponderosae]